MEIAAFELEANQNLSVLYRASRHHLLINFLFTFSTLSFSLFEFILCFCIYVYYELEGGLCLTSTIAALATVIFLQLCLLNNIEQDVHV